MKRSFLCLFFFISIIFFGGCKKDKHQNQIPIADAGSYDSITLSDNLIKLNGTGKDADGKVVAYLWSQVSGPNTSNIVNPGSPSTEVNNLLAGVYIFQLMVTDNDGAVGVDTASIIVKPSPIVTLTLQPNNNPYEYEIVNLGGQDLSGTAPEITLAAWTKDGKPYILRDVVKFDLTTIPTKANIISANLYLFSNPTPLTGNFVDANFGSNNTLILQQVTSEWSGSTIGWFNQPSTSTTNQIIIPSTTQSVLDLNVDVTDMIKSMVSGNANFGFFLKLQNETSYTSRIFVSSFNTKYPQKHPKLIIVYK